jgi:hypothetical protein
MSYNKEGNKTAMENGKEKTWAEWQSAYLKQLQQICDLLKNIIETFVKREALIQELDKAVVGKDVLQYSLFAVVRATVESELQSRSAFMEVLKLAIQELEAWQDAVPFEIDEAEQIEKTD